MKITNLKIGLKVWTNEFLNDEFLLSKKIVAKPFCNEIN